MYRTILVPIDLSHAEHGRKILTLARRIGGDKCRIVALYVAADIPTFVASELPEGILQANLSRARADLSALADEARAEAKIRSGHPSASILEEAEGIGADLIVIASHRPGLQDYFLGSTASRVVRHANCAVLVDR